jgi:Peptidase_C39 like family
MSKREYKPLIQEPYCCVPTCLSIILDSRQIPHGTQKEIGVELGFIMGHGTQVEKEQYSINNYFQKNQIDLQEEYILTNEISKVKELINSNLQEGNDIIACFNNKELHGKGDAGHVSIIQSIEDETIILIDPEEDVPKIREVSLNALIDAMNYHGEKNRGGFWIIKKS